MTWPFENDTSAIVKKLAGRSMQADKRNKAFLLLTIAISVCMVFSILLISTGTQEKFKNTQRNKAQMDNNVHNIPEALSSPSVPHETL